LRKRDRLIPEKLGPTFVMSPLLEKTIGCGSCGVPTRVLTCLIRWLKTMDLMGLAFVHCFVFDHDILTRGAAVE
jgi:hypothetical protein